MGNLTPRLGLYKPGGGSTGSIPDEPVDIDKINGNFDRLDVSVGFLVVTSTSRPVQPFTGQGIYETDTDSYHVWSGAEWKGISSTDADTISGHKIFVQSGTPSGATSGDLWFW